MRIIAGIICITAVILFLGLPFIGMMILFGLFCLLAQFAFGGNK
ncbi:MULTISPECIES: hypothetical protein [Acinetobacter]|nr:MULTISPECIES: hypothetical protein [Acinetobacter]